MKSKGQAIVLDVLFFSLCLILILYFEVLFFENYAKEQIENQKETEKLELLLFVDKMVSDCDYLAFTEINHQSLCYQNILDLRSLLVFEKELKKNKICRIKLSDIVIYQTETTEIELSIKRGIVINNGFKILEFAKCK
ncbi:MAG TPA: hypothetical protein PK655_01625 [archaeon]|jgi:hypothetical protein|nr:hypothetical protein [archaeon]HPV66134.1 hypothetical protein [archaeon]